LPELRRHDSYKVIAEAKYKDYRPIEFALDVRYLPNLDGKVRFVDLGTHVFFKKWDRPQSPYVFYLANVMDDGRNEDYDNYEFVLNDGMENYFRLEEQESEINLPQADTRDVPRIGENTALVTSNDMAFQDSDREFFTLPAQFTNIEIPLVSQLRDGELAVVLTWTEGTTIKGTQVLMQNMDLHVEFQPAEDVLCTVDHAMR
jgi:hypothetical protein